MRDVIHHAVAALSQGQIVAVPTETVYGLAASALNPEAVERLADIKGRDVSKPFAFAIKSDQDALDYVPNMSRLARRLARRCWPGPVTLVLEDSHPDSALVRIPESVRKLSVLNGTIGLRVPAHDVTLQILRLLAGPIVLTSANQSGGQPATDGNLVEESLGQQIDLIINDGACKFGEASSVVKVVGNEVEFLRKGVVDEETLKRISGFIAVVVCTGNTCRSPMGEALLKRQIANKLGCEISELQERGVVVMSAGIAAMSGCEAAPQAVEVMKSIGLNIEDHSSQTVTAQIAQYADAIFTMTSGHRHALLSQWPALESRTHTVRRDGGDISDPIGSPVEVYRKCAKQIEDNLAEWVQEIEL